MVVFIDVQVTWRLPQPFGCPFFVIDKLEMDKKGDVKLEASSDKATKGLKIDFKPDLKAIFILRSWDFRATAAHA